MGVINTWGISHPRKSRYQDDRTVLWDLSSYYVRPFFRVFLLGMTWLCSSNKKGRTNSTYIYKGFVRPFSFMTLIMSHFDETKPARLRSQTGGGEIHFWKEKDSSVALQLRSIQMLWFCSLSNDSQCHSMYPPYCICHYPFVGFNKRLKIILTHWSLKCD